MLSDISIIFSQKCVILTTSSSKSSWVGINLEGCIFLIFDWLIFTMNLKGIRITPNYILANEFKINSLLNGIFSFLFQLLELCTVGSTSTKLQIIDSNCFVLVTQDTEYVLRRCKISIMTWFCYVFSLFFDSCHQLTTITVY